MRVKQRMEGVLAGLLLLAATVSYGAFDQSIPVTGEVDGEEVTYYDSKFARGTRQIFYNFRDGALGLGYNVWQLGNGVVAGVGIGTGKALVLAGDVVGLADDNMLTRLVLRGFFSDIIEQASYYDFRIVKSLMLASHDLDDIPIIVDREPYIEDESIFKTRLYLRPWAVIVLPGTVVADGIIRPAASVAKMFSIQGYTDLDAPEIPEDLDAFGVRLLLAAYREPFFLPLPEEEIPDLRIYTEEEIVGGVLPPGPRLRP